MSTNAKSQLAAVERALSRRMKGDRTFEDESEPLLLFGDPVSAEAVLFIAKPSFAQRIVSTRAARRCLVLSKYGVLCEATARSLEWFGKALRLEVGFVGDLDIHDVAAFAALRHRAAARIRVHWLGISYPWVETSSKRFIRPDFKPEVLQFKESSLEMQRWKLIQEVWPTIRAEMGKDNSSFLDRGLKIEVEGLCNQRIFHRGHVEALVARMVSAYRSRTRRNSRRTSGILLRSRSSIGFSNPGPASRGGRPTPP